MGAAENDGFLISAKESLERLQGGNARFVSARQVGNALASHSHHNVTTGEQRPFAIILGCSDSRVPAEIVFDQGLGDLFVIRVAGNIVAPSQVGSVEFAVERFATRLVVVLGHSMCGAVIAALEAIPRSADGGSPNLRSIVDRIRPSIEPLLRPEYQSTPESLLQLAVRANIRASVKGLREGSEILEQHVINDEIVIVGAEYSLQTGVVEFLDDIPDTA